MTIFNVATNSELLSAFASAVGGDEIIGAAGADLGDLTIAAVNFSSHLRFTSADPANMCALSNMYLNNCSFIDIDRAAMNYVFKAGDPSSF